MKLLTSQIELEELLGRQQNPDPNAIIPTFAVIYFTASWCSACKALDLDRIQRSLPEPTWYKCDVDQNQYSPGYCNIRSIPSFVVIKDKKVAGTFQSNTTDKVIQWVAQFK
jgi:thioredoxin-like negative regulator of GroEL